MSKICIFLGAGSSTIFNKPTTKKFKENLIKELRLRNNDFEIAKEVIFLYEKHKDVEYILQCIRDLREISKVGSEFLFGNSVNNYNYNNTSVKFSDLYKYLDDIEEYIIEKLFQYYRWDPNHEKFIEQAINPIINLLKKYGSDIRIATTNYDTIVEHSIKSVDGFTYDENDDIHKWNPSVFDSTIVDKLILYKLHGSLTWREHSSLGFIKEPKNEEKIINTAELTNLLIYPTLSPKDGHEKDPFKTIRKKFKDFLLECDLCLIIGFSFRDEHVTKIFTEYLSSGKLLIILSPTAEENIKSNDDLMKFIDVQNLKIINENFSLNFETSIIEEIIPH